MANTTIAGGLRLFKNGDSGSQPIVRCAVRSGDSTALFVGDAVQLDSTDGAISSGSGPTVPEVKRAGSSGAIYGVVIGTEPQMTFGQATQDLSKRYRPASTFSYLLVRRASPADTYEIMDDGTLASGSSSALGAINVGLNANVSFSTAGSTSTGMSNMQLAGSTANTTATLQLKILEISPRSGNDVTSVNACWLVSINNCQTNSGGTGTAGV